MASATSYKITPSRLRDFQGTIQQYCVYACLWDLAFEFGGLPDSIEETANLTQLDAPSIASVWPQFIDCCAKTAGGKWMPLAILTQLHDARKLSEKRAASGRQGGKISRADREKKRMDAIPFSKLWPKQVLNGQTNSATVELSENEKPLSVLKTVNGLPEAIAYDAGQTNFVSGSTTINSLPEAIACLALDDGERQAIACECSILGESTTCGSNCLRARSPLINIYNNTSTLGEESINTISPKESNTEYTKGERARRQAFASAPFDPIDPEDGEIRNNIGDALQDVFPGTAMATRDLLALMTYALNVAGTADDVRRWPSWFATRYPNRAETSLAFKDSFHQMLREKTSWSTGMRFLLAVCQGINAQQIVDANNLVQKDLNQARSIGRSLEKVTGLSDAVDWKKRGFMPAAYLDFWTEKFPNAGKPAASSVLKYWPDFEMWLKVRA